MPLVPLQGLKKPGDVPVCVFDRCNQLSPTDVLDCLLYLCPSLQELVQTGLYVVCVPVARQIIVTISNNW
jgi:hypothetical protein